jgi:hypothetical protein
MEWKPPEAGKRKKKPGTPKELTFKHDVPQVW